MSGEKSWGFGEGDEIAPGRTVLRPLGGGSHYEVLLVWDDLHYAIMVAKVLRPAVAADEAALRDLEREAQALGALAHPVILRGFDAMLGVSTKQPTATQSNTATKTGKTGASTKG